MEHIKASLERYQNDKIKPGSFLTAVLENNLTEALARADWENKLRLHEIVSYVYNNIPMSIWGSPEAVRNHLKS